MPRDNNSKRRRRAYIGNLRPRQLLADNLYNDLFIPHCLSVHDNINGITIPQSTNKNKSNTYALVEFVDTDYAIQMLNGVQFDGRVLRVCKEKTNFGSSVGGGGFGSSQWAGSDRFKSNSSSGGGGKKRQSKPTPAAQKVENKTPIIDDIMGMNGEEAINKQIESTISSEIQESNDKITSALACTAAMTLLSSMDAFGLNKEEKKGETSHNESDDTVKEAVDNTNMTNQDFQSRCKMNLSDLMAEYGEQDVDWNKQPKKNDKNMNNDDFQSRCKLPLSDLMAEYGEKDVEWKKDQHHNQSSTKNNRSDNKSENTGMLAHFNKASIHLELVSFGYKYGGPSKKGGFSFANPLPSIDIRDLDRCPGNYGKFNGLSSYVKKALLNPKQQQHTNDGYTEDNDEHEQQNTNNSQSPMRLRANQIADEVIKILVEAIDEGGHGPISPLTMTVSIGSEYGRHRSVVLVEHLSVILRARLRRNDGSCFNTTGEKEGADNNNKPIKNNGIIKQLVSVGTRHRDVEARHTDEEAFCGDLKREERKVEKRKRQQQAEEEDSGWDNGSW